MGTNHGITGRVKNEAHWVRDAIFVNHFVRVNDEPRLMCRKLFLKRRWIIIRSCWSVKGANLPAVHRRWSPPDIRRPQSAVSRGQLSLKVFELSLNWWKHNFKASLTYQSRRLVIPGETELPQLVLNLLSDFTHIGGFERLITWLKINCNSVYHSRIILLLIADLRKFTQEMKRVTWVAI